MANTEIKVPSASRLHSVEDARQQLNCGRTKFYELLKSGELEARKIGRRTLITDEALGRFITSLPVKEVA